MAISESPSTSSRRSVLAAAVGGVAGAFLASLGRAAPALAEGQAIVVGGEYTDATSLTKIQNSTDSTNVFEARSSFGGSAVTAVSVSGNGIYAQTNSSMAVGAYASTGTALFGACSDPTGYSLNTEGGRIFFEDVSGVATIPAGTKSVIVSLVVDIDASAFVLLTPGVNVGGRSLWCTIDAVANSITIRMSSTRSSATKIGWLLLSS